MKTIPALAFIAALAAFVLFPFEFQTGISVLFAAGLGTLMISDYSRRMKPLRLPAPVPAAVRQRTERFGLAA